MENEDVRRLRAALRAEGRRVGRGRTHSPAVLAGLGGPLPLGYVHLGVAKEIVPTLRGFGVDADLVIHGAGLDPAIFENESSVIPFASFGRLFTLCVAWTKCPHFGFLVGRRATIQSLG